jgi:2-polyprenyl-3-methyl-5-hydroxy-6-metoxy-1,4-benzoquinol methylase
MSSERAKKAWEEVAALQQYTESDCITMGPHTSYQYRTDPKHLCFVLSRYKFCGKLLGGRNSVLEVGCGDAFGTPLVAQTAKNLVGIDWDARLVASTKERLAHLTNCEFKQHDIIEGKPFEQRFDGIYSLDVIEHIDPEMEEKFMLNCCESLDDKGILIIGTPNETASAYASPSSQIGHINLKSASALQQLLSKYFETTFLFGMNDEVVHTGFLNMAHYLFGVAVGVRRG